MWLLDLFVDIEAHRSFVGHIFGNARSSVGRIMVLLPEKKKCHDINLLNQDGSVFTESESNLSHPPPSNHSCELL